MASLRDFELGKKEHERPSTAPPRLVETIAPPPTPPPEAALRPSTAMGQQGQQNSMQLTRPVSISDAASGLHAWLRIYARTAPRRGGSMRGSLSRASLASSGLFTGTLMSRRSRSASLSPTPKSTNHGRSYSPRRFASRHVPTAAEELAAHSHFLDPMIIKRFDGLMKHLKRNTDKQDFEKQVLASPPEVLVPEEYDEVLRGEFARHCSYGERYMEGGALKMIWGAEELPPFGGPCLSSLAAADIIFQRVLHDTNYGGKRLTYDFFCKALCLVAADIYPELDWESAMGELLNRIASAAEDVEIVNDEPGDFSLDPNVLLVLEHFKPKLHNLFRSFARRQLRGPTDAKALNLTCEIFHFTNFDPFYHFQKVVWMEEILYSEQDTMFASRASSCMLGATLKDEAPEEDEVEETLSPGGPGALPAVTECEAEDHGHDHPVSPGSGEETQLPHQVASPKKTMPQPMLPQNAMGFEVSMSTRTGQWSPVANDPYTYACGSPTLKNRRKYMSLDQLFALCKELKIMPDTISRQAVVRIFKRAQCAGSQSQHAGSNFGLFGRYLTQEAFVDAIGRIGIQAYSEDTHHSVNFSNLPLTPQGAMMAQHLKPMPPKNVTGFVSQPPLMPALEAFVAAAAWAQRQERPSSSSQAALPKVDLAALAAEGKDKDAKLTILKKPKGEDDKDFFFEDQKPKLPYVKALPSKVDQLRRPFPKELEERWKGGTLNQDVFELAREEEARKKGENFERPDTPIEMLMEDDEPDLEEDVYQVTSSVAFIPSPRVTSSVASIPIAKPGVSRVPTVFASGVPPWAEVTKSPPPPPPPKAAPKAVAKEVAAAREAVSPKTPPKASKGPSSVLESKGSQRGSRGSSSAPVPERVNPVFEVETAKFVPAIEPVSGLPFKAAPPALRSELRSVKAKLGSSTVPKYQLAPVPERFPPTNPIPTGLAPAVASPPLEVRVSLDYHNTLNCEVAGGNTYDGIRTSAANAIASFLAASQHHQVGVCSFIGWSGWNSQQKRRELESAVIRLNQQLQTRGIPLSQLCHLFITSDRAKHPVNSNTCQLHLDDKWDVIQAVSARGVTGIHFSRQGQFTQVDQVLRHAAAQLVPKAYTSAWWGVPPHHSYD
eukprot:s45_g5.t1